MNYAAVNISANVSVPERYPSFPHPSAEKPFTVAACSEVNELKYHQRYRMVMMPRENYASKYRPLLASAQGPDLGGLLDGPEGDEDEDEDEAEEKPYGMAATSEAD